MTNNSDLEDHTIEAMLQLKLAANVGLNVGIIKIRPLYDWKNVAGGIG